METARGNAVVPGAPVAPFAPVGPWMGATGPKVGRMAVTRVSTPVCGGGFSTGGQIIDLTASFPSNSAGTPTASGTNPTSRTARFASATGSNTAYVLCTP
jgi:hypothetical protein